jgi:hypothetical protein
MIQKKVPSAAVIVDLPFVFQIVVDPAAAVAAAVAEVVVVVVVVV